MAKDKTHGIVIHGNKQSFFMRLWQKNPQAPWEASLEQLEDQDDEAMPGSN